MALYVYIFHLIFTFAREPTGTDGNPKTPWGKIISIAWVIGLQNSSHVAISAKLIRIAADVVLLAHPLPAR